jgi:hypothetical protein
MVGAALSATPLVVTRLVCNRNMQGQMPESMNNAADYEYDVFFSYKRHRETAEWTRNVRKYLTLWLSEEIQGPVKIFVDEETIETGDRWPEKIKDGLKSSRCMVSLWSPLYFQSNWCVSEWKSFMEREKNLDLAPHGLIAPVRFHDGEHFPAEAKLVQALDLREYASALPAFWNSPRSLELEDKIKDLARSVAAILGRVPAFRPNWPVIEAAGVFPPIIPLGRL